MLTNSQLAEYVAIQAAAGGAHSAIVQEIDRLASMLPTERSPDEGRTLRILRERQKQFEPFSRNLGYQMNNGLPYSASTMMPVDIASFISDPLGNMA